MATISKSNQHIVGPYVNMHTRCEVSMTICMGSRANQRKVSKWLLFENYMSECLENTKKAPI